ncbi:hypothetical protein X739_29810 [Mesorhizobium sp. LNHC220B00]|uniref:hypothetical protein n=1 Tax=Mesorhizobium sp. LNHC229A00 TaxID=1287240 RepID=UPI0003CE34F1|nr:MULTISPECIES: hypothetical protein [unclassified Mesorhizobium]ESY79962.1 hypothetical protein X739_29810 [Mesorhizobium sp. LNHC220B00]ESY80395.1 hypothetical protein X741_34285 [Mesorhizobium sp. LNHC229A00]
MPLQDKLDQITANLIKSGRIPEPLIEQLMESIRNLVASGLADRALKGGDIAPRFLLDDATGKTVSSRSFLPVGRWSCLKQLYSILEKPFVIRAEISDRVSLYLRGRFEVARAVWLHTSELVS